MELVVYESKRPYPERFTLTMIKILYADELPVYSKEKLSRCSGADQNLSSAEWRFMTYATADLGTAKNIRELKRAARKQAPKQAPKQAEPPLLKKRSKVPAKPVRKKTEAKLQQVSITVGIVGEDISQATFANMKRFMESRATVGLIALERGDATLQLHIQGVLALLRQYYPGLRWLLSPKMSYERAESLWRLATAPESTTLKDVDFTFYGLQPTERYHTYNFNESMLYHAQEKAQAREAEDIEQQLQALEERIRGTTLAADPDENNVEDEAAEQQSPAEWQDLGDYIPLV
ncbi:hypothetical protein R1sor_009046 [Riccia sorocarpa]|uniref:Uncharacterized protein n=1 Tax=Riccia sorocarpa TaxID=122646 RepID=A0ABD3H7H6_9MARC